MPAKQKAKPKAARYDLDFVRQAASSRWPEVLSHVTGIDVDHLDGQHHPCPKCGGTDRFRYFNDSEGGFICNGCRTSKCRDGFSFIQWMTGNDDFLEAIRLVAEYIGIQPESSGTKKRSKSSKPKADPAEKLTFVPWSDQLAALWCLTKPPITVDALKRCHARMARYREQYTVIALPVWGEQLQSADPVGWSMYNITGGELPKFAKDEQTGKTIVAEWVKVKLTFGSKTGVIGPVEFLSEATHAWKLEGPSDLLTWHALVNIPKCHAAFTNANGAGEMPDDWLVGLLKNKTVHILHDADTPGQHGAKGHENKSGKHQAGWLDILAKAGINAVLVTLPYEVQPTHGKDLRDYINERANHGPAI